MIERIADEIIAIQGQPNPTLLVLQKQLDETEKGIENFLKAIQQGIITESTKQRLAELEKEKAELQIAIQKEELSKSLLTKDGIIQYINKFKYGDKDSIEYKRNIIDNFVNAVYVFDDHLIIVFNCKAGTKRVRLSTASEITGSDVDTQSPPGSDSP